ncbi:UNVERIFIED_CONTAM: hypothetical protein Slati_0424100 [Sesamum latifolium]|uniref:Uncharacterized protein n=1 Tax=Sesamum latifolium TaxID=2727402 RepID=A0AAW2XV09_9LAMI
MATENEHVSGEESTTEVVMSQEEEIPHLIKDKTLSKKKLRRYDSLDVESGNLRHPHHGGAAPKYWGWCCNWRSRVSEWCTGTSERRCTCIPALLVVESNTTMIYLEFCRSSFTP